MATIHTTFESYDDEFQKKAPIKRSELRNLAKLDFKDKYEKGRSMNKNHGDLQTAISNMNYVDNRISMYDPINDLVVSRLKNIPFVSKKAYPDSREQKMIFESDTPLGFIKYQKFKAQLSLTITYNLEEVDYMDIEKGTYNLHFSTRITRDATGYSPTTSEEDKETARIIGLLYGNGDTLNYDVIQRILYDAPEPADKEFADNSTISKKNLTYSSLSVLMNKVKFNANLFKDYCKENYNVNIF